MNDKEDTRSSEARSNAISRRDLIKGVIVDKQSEGKNLRMNIAGALFFGAFVYVVANRASMKPTNDSAYLFLRSMYRVIDFLGLPSQNPVATSEGGRQFPMRSEELGADVFVIVTWLGIAAAATLLLWLLRNTWIYRVIVGQTALTILLFAAPACYLWIS